ncbi:type II toxin-antitoxin system RelE/ParE family toxin [Comamonas sp. NLF-1-9]|uniref:type II toxin-antitoxin system RelE/ParE family toxin n=1 Tax=Comamonas sp. NLF-1-9 TaxID=2853163 RepID=UPI002105908C|nr:type II toxin-antitoxin system RelE/ParE family toxin [Comamonas sp. NLF-1-9]
MKALHRRIQASQDIDQTIAYYSEHASKGVADRFLDELELALQHIAQHPGTGSPRHARKLHINNLRFWPLTRFPYSVFYIEHADHIDVLRVLHQASNIPRHLQSK